MKYKLIAFDLDGTLLTNEKKLPEKNREILIKAAREGAYIVPSTGRFYTALPQEIKEIPQLRYAITINGANVVDIKENKTVYKSEISYAEAEEVFDYLSKLPIIFDCYQDDYGWMDRKFYEALDTFIDDIPIREITKATRHVTEDFRALMRERKRDVQKIQMAFRDPELRITYLKKLADDFPNLVVSSSLYNNIEINAKGANKGIALKKLCEYLNVDLSEAIAFGDGTNDLDLLKTAGYSVAMENAAPAVKEAADFVTLSNEECGVYEVLKNFF